MALITFAALCYRVFSVFDKRTHVHMTRSNDLIFPECGRTMLVKSREMLVELDGLLFFSYCNWLGLLYLDITYSRGKILLDIGRTQNATPISLLQQHSLVGCVPHLSSLAAVWYYLSQHSSDCLCITLVLVFLRLAMLACKEFQNTYYNSLSLPPPRISLVKK